MINLIKISKSYKEKSGNFICVLNGVSLDIKKGQFTAITGPSGCGKSTLLLIAGSLLHPDRGRVIINDQEITHMNAGDKAAFRANTLGFVFQRFHLIPYLTVAENIQAAHLGARDASSPSRERVGELMDMLRIEHRSDHLPGELSVGEMQRTALARALFNQPNVILADEPSGNLDPENARVVMACFRDFASGGGTVLMVTHRPEDAAKADVTHQLVNGIVSP